MNKVHTERIRPVTWALAFYISIMCTDCMNLGGIVSMTKVFVMIPVVVSLLDLKKLKIRLDLVSLLLILYLFYCLATVIWSCDSSYSLSKWNNLMLNILLIYVVGCMETYSKKETQLLLKSLIASSWVTVIFLVLFNDVSQGARLTLQLGGEIQDQNYLNGYLLFAFAWHLIQYLKTNTRIHLVLTGLLLLICLMTGSRGALLAYGAVFVAGVITVKRDVNEWGKTLFQFICLMVLILSLYCVSGYILPAEVSERFTISYLMKKGTTGRTRTWKYLLTYFYESDLLRQLFGNGYNTTRVVNSMNHRVAHNLYIDLLISSGIVGLLLQICIQIAVYFRLLFLKNNVLRITFIGFLVMCLSLSLTSYRPMWNLIIVMQIIYYSSTGRSCTYI